MGEERIVDGDRLAAADDSEMREPRPRPGGRAVVDDRIVGHRPRRAVGNHRTLLIGETEVEPGEAVMPRLTGDAPLEFVPGTLAPPAGLGKDLERRQRLLEGDVDGVPLPAHRQAAEHP